MARGNSKGRADGKRSRAARSAARGSGSRASLYDDVTATIIGQLEEGLFPWVRPWSKAKASLTLSDLVRSALRLRPDRIPIGEVRGAEALDLLKAWGTGHPGGIGTIHAGSALGTLRRLEQLIQESVVTVPRALIAETIDIIAVLVRDGTGRRLAELAKVRGLDEGGEYVLIPLSPTKGEPS